MLSYIIRKLAYGILVLILVVITISSVIYLAPVDPARLTFGQRSDTASLEAKRKELGLDQSLFTQLVAYLSDLSPISIIKDKEKYSAISLIPLGERALVLKWPYLRESFQSGKRVSAILSEAVPRTLLLAGAAILLAILIGIPLGVMAAIKQHSFLDNVAVVGSVLGFSIPSYVSAMLLALVFGYFLQSYTGLQVSGSVYGMDDFGDDRFFWKNLILPAIALGIRPVAIITQLTRSAMLDVLAQDYIRTARAKGLGTRAVLFKHALRNALNPVATAISGWFAALLAGAFFVENVFQFNGLGQVTVNALLNYDIPVVLGAVLFTATVFVLVNLLMDLLYVVIDPRIRIT
ncbi:MAG: peptide/nickel transport system permease protein [Polaribacter sp.]|jgi:peptide/nickel transport system permease protein